MGPLVIAWFKVPWEAGIIRVADEFLLKRKRKKKEQKNEWNGGRKQRKKGPRKEKGDPRVLRARYVRVRKWTERIKKEKEKKNELSLYIYPRMIKHMYIAVVCASSLFRWKWKLRTVQLLPSLIVYLCRKGNDIEFVYIYIFIYTKKISSNHLFLLFSTLFFFLFLFLIN